MQRSKLKSNRSFVAQFIPLYGPYNAFSMEKKNFKIAASTWDYVTPLAEDRTTAIGNKHEKFGKDRSCSSGDTLSDRHTHTDRQTHRRVHDNTSSLLLQAK